MAMTEKEFWNQKSFVVITGASRGLGKSIAIEFSKKVASGSTFLLIARNSTALEQTKNEVKAVAPGVNVVTSVTDLGRPDAARFYNEIASSVKVIAGENPNDFEHSILVHNAASLGKCSRKVAQYEDLQEIDEYYRLNLSSAILLTSQFLRVFCNPKKQRTIVNISSMAALTPVKSWGNYCMAKTAREMLMKCVAAEDPSIQTLNYGPGTFQSDMYEEAALHTGDEQLRAYFRDLPVKGKLSTAEQTTLALVKILEEKKFSKGEHVEFSDA